MCPAWGTKRIYASFFVVSIFAINHRRIDIECNKRFHNSIINHGLSHNSHLQANELKFVQSAQFFSTWLVYYDELNAINCKPNYKEKPSNTSTALKLGAPVESQIFFLNFSIALAYPSCVNGIFVFCENHDLNYTVFFQRNRDYHCLTEVKEAD